MEMRELISTFDSALKAKLVELSRLEKEVAVLKSTISNDIRSLNEILKNNCKHFSLNEEDNGPK